ncbi:hypothetical protein AVEN_91521-1 [Araneus ventricosus]|uniref:Uncharacterized protein n=1 Tax=Araneus ventricosus TaxID=182803 RepID=A0A4Y2BJP7_ARAVE|nr:hypothetical protein AVEN_91521-1 [Araneus ventricosus]
MPFGVLGTLNKSCCDSSSSEAGVAIAITGGDPTSPEGGTYYHRREVTRPPPLLYPPGKLLKRKVISEARNIHRWKCLETNNLSLKMILRSVSCISMSWILSSMEKDKPPRAGFVEARIG